MFESSLHNCNKYTFDALQENPHLILYTDTIGVSSLEKAVLSGDIQMIDIFLKRCPENMVQEVVNYAILYAIRENDVKLVKHLTTADVR